MAEVCGRSSRLNCLVPRRDGQARSKFNFGCPLFRNIYNTRADCENRILELKQDIGLDAFCLQGFWATEASFRFITVA